MNKVFYIHDAQDIWLFSGLLESGSKILYNNSSNKVTAPSSNLSKLLFYWPDFDLTPVNGINENLNSIIDGCDYFICKECLPFTKDYLSLNPEFTFFKFVYKKHTNFSITYSNSNFD